MSRRLPPLLLGLLFVAAPAFADAVKGHPFVGATFTDNRVVFVDADGKAEREVKVTAPFDVWRLADGTVLVASRAQGILSIGKDAEPKVLFKPEGETYSCQPLPGGGVLVGDNRGRRLLEIDAAGKIVKEVALQGKSTEHTFLRSARKTAAGTYLACHRGDNAVREYDAAGKVVWEVAANGPMTAVRLPSGHTLIAGLSDVVEVDPAGKAVWKLDVKGLGIKGKGYGVQRLPNGNTAVCFEGGVYEVTPDQKLVWSLASKTTTGLMCFHLLDVPGDPAKGEVHR